MKHTRDCPFLPCENTRDYTLLPYENLRSKNSLVSISWPMLSSLAQCFGKTRNISAAKTRSPLFLLSVPYGFLVTRAVCFQFCGPSVDGCEIALRAGVAGQLAARKRFHRTRHKKADLFSAAPPWALRRATPPSHAEACYMERVWCCQLGRPRWWGWRTHQTLHDRA